jgi:hypothetical protein
MIAGRRRACIFSTNVHIYGAWNAADGHLFWLEKEFDGN